MSCLPGHCKMACQLQLLERPTPSLAIGRQPAVVSASSLHRRPLLPPVASLPLLLHPSRIHCNNSCPVSAYASADNHGACCNCCTSPHCAEPLCPACISTQVCCQMHCPRLCCISPHIAQDFAVLAATAASAPAAFGRCHACHGCCPVGCRAASLGNTLRSACRSSMRAPPTCSSATSAGTCTCTPLPARSA